MQELLGSGGVKVSNFKKKKGTEKGTEKINAIESGPGKVSHVDIHSCVLLFELLEN